MKNKKNKNKINKKAAENITLFVFEQYQGGAKKPKIIAVSIFF